MESCEYEGQDVQLVHQHIPPTNSNVSLQLVLVSGITEWKCDFLCVSDLSSSVDDISVVSGDW